MSLPNNPHCIIEIEATSGKVVWDSWKDKQLFESCEVELPTNQSAECRWKFFDPEFKLIDSFAGTNGVPLSVVRCFMGYGKNLGEPIFKGLLAQVQRSDSSTTFVAFDMSFKMKLVKKAGYKNKRTDLQVLGDLAKRNDLKFEGPEKAKKLGKNDALMQDEQTDWQWATERAREAGLVLFVRQDTLFAKYPATVGEVILTLKNRKDFVLKNDFDFQFNTPEAEDGTPTNVQVRARGKGGKRIAGQSDKDMDCIFDDNCEEKSKPRGRGNVVLKRNYAGKKSKKKLSARATAQKELEREHAFQCYLSTVLPINGEKLDVRNTIEVQNVGQLFSGKYICDSVRYVFSASNVGLDLTLYRDIAV